MDGRDEGVDLEARPPVEDATHERLSDVLPDEEDLSPTSDQSDGHDDAPTDFNNEQLDPDISQLFPNSHIRREGEQEVLALAHTQLLARAPPQPSRRSRQEGDSPVVRSGSMSDLSSANSSDAGPQSSNGSAMEFDAGLLFPGSSQPEIANSLASRRGKDSPAGLDSGAARGGEEDKKVSSATFRRTLRAHVADPQIRLALEEEFDRLNDAKNELATTAWGWYKRKEGEFEELMNDYYAGAGGERRRVRLEAEFRAKEASQARRERETQMALHREAMLTGLRSGDWPIDPKTGQLASPVGEVGEDWFGLVGGRDSDEEAEDSDEGSQKRRQFYSDEEDPRDDGDDADGGVSRRFSNDGEVYGDKKTRIQLQAAADAGSREKGMRIRPAVALDDDFSTAGHRTRESVLSVDKPLPAIPARETAQTMVGIHVLLRLLPVKIKLVERLSSTSSSRRSSSSSSSSNGPHTHQATYDICERASAVCTYAEENGASLDLQGRCAFYMGLAEFLQSKIEKDGDGGEGEGLAMAKFHLENCVRLCGDEVEEGEWAAEWVWWLGRRMSVAVEARESGAGKVVEREGEGERVVDSFWGWLLGKDKKGGKAVEGRKDAPVPMEEEAEEEGQPIPDPVGGEEVGKGRAGSSFSRWFAARRDRKAQQPEEDEIVETGDGEVDLPSQIFGGLRPISDLNPRRSPKTQHAMDLELDTDVLPAEEAQNAILSPAADIFTSPEGFANGWTRSAADPTVHGVREASEVYSPDVGPCPKTQAPPPTEPSAQAAPKRRYIIANPNNLSAARSGGDKNDSLPAPATTTSPAVPPGGSGIISTLARRFSSTLAISPTTDNSATHSPQLPTTSEHPEEEEETDGNVRPASTGSGNRLSIAERRSSIATLGSLLLRGGRSPTKAQETLAEEGESPSFQTSFERDSGQARSPLGSPQGSGDGAEGGVRRRSGGRRTDGEMV